MILSVDRLKDKIKFLLIRIVIPAFLKGIYYFLLRKEKTLLIIKNDGIGDYIIFRNFLEFLKKSKKYRNYKIYFLGNPVNKDLAVFLDSEYIDCFFWYADSYFLKWNLVKLLFNLQNLRLETIIYPNYSRKFTTDWLVKNINAKEKITVKGDTVNQSINLKQKGDQHYTQILNVSAENLHEFERNIQIMEVISQEKCEFNRPYVDAIKIKKVQSSSVVIFPGGSENQKKWSSSNYNSLCRRISSELKLNLILAGGVEDLEDGQLIQEGINNSQIQNKIAQLSLVELYELIGSAQLLISNDTVAIHMATTLNVPSVCIAKGDLFGRFIPYPDHIGPETQCVFPPNLMPSKDQTKWSVMNINDVLLEDVYAAVRFTLTRLAIL